MSDTVERPVILCQCGHEVKHHTESFGTTCAFYRCECKGWQIDKDRSNREFLTLDGKNE